MICIQNEQLMRKIQNNKSLQINKIFHSIKKMPKCYINVIVYKLISNYAYKFLSQSRRIREQIIL